MKHIGTYTSEIFVEAFRLEMFCSDKAYIDAAIVKDSVKKIMVANTSIGDLTGANAQHALLMEITGMMDCHPEGWEGDCNCNECRTAE